MNSKGPVCGVVRDKHGRIKFDQPTLARMRQLEHVLDDQDIADIKADHPDDQIIQQFRRLRAFTGKPVRRRPQ